MTAYVLRRLGLMVPTLLGITLLSFALLQLVPGDPARLRFATAEQSGDVAPEAVERLRREYLLDAPLWKRYLHFLGPFDLSPRGARFAGGSGERTFGGLLALDLETELHRPHVRVADELGRRLAVTVPLALAALVVAYAVAVPIGVLSALRRRSLLARASVLATFLLYSVPVFWAGLLLQLAFGQAGLGWLPALGLPEPGADSLLARVEHGLLPVLTLSIAPAAYLSRLMRAGMLEVLPADFLRAARARGLPERTVILKHALRNALIPIATLSASIVPALLGGSVVVETVFDLPGVGRYEYEGLQQRDVFVVMATTTLAAVTTCVGILLADLLCAALDPRLQHD